MPSISWYLFVPPFLFCILLGTTFYRTNYLAILKTNTTQEKISCSLVLKLKVFISKYLQEHYTQCIARARLFFKNVPGTFFNATHQVKQL